jgi:hypothetical protein
MGGIGPGGQGSGGGSNSNNGLSPATVNQERYGRNLALLQWYDGSEVFGPAAGGTLVTHAVSSGKTGYIYGWQVTTDDSGNDFHVQWTSGGSAKSIRVTFGGKGTTQELFGIAYNEGEAADANTNVLITVTGAGISFYQGRLLYGEL